MPDADAWHGCRKAGSFNNRSGCRRRQAVGVGTRFTHDEAGSSHQCHILTGPQGRFAISHTLNIGNLYWSRRVRDSTVSPNP